jgi:hypothetical protein
MGQGDIPTSRGGPLRRRREKRQLEHLAEESDREVSPGTDRTHVRVIEDLPAARTMPDPGETERDPEPPAPSTEGQSSGFHVRAVPIDQPFDT